MAPLQKAMIFVSCSYSFIQRSHTFINDCFFCVGLWWFVVVVFNFAGFKKLSCCNSASIPDFNNAESLSTKFNGREGPRLSSLDLKILSFFFNCLTKWPYSCKTTFSQCRVNGYTDLLQERSTDRHIWGKKHPKNLRVEASETPSWQRMYISLKSKESTSPWGGFLSEGAFQVVLAYGGGHASSSTGCF